MGDIHGAHLALQQCLERCGFDIEEDTLIQLGDVTDGRPYVFECVELLLKIRNLIAIKGNHDNWFNEFLQSGCHPDKWQQGGKDTAISYLRQINRADMIKASGDGFLVALNPGDVPDSHQLFFSRQALYYVDDSNNLFIHAGFNRRLPFKEQPQDVYYWDRKLWLQALSFEATARNEDHAGVFQMETVFNEIFIGHTPTINWKTDQPMKAANIWNLDTGAGHNGRLTIMDLQSKQHWQSDPVEELYK